MIKPIDPWPRPHRPLASRIIDIVRRYRRPVPPEIRGPMSDACDWLAGKWNKPTPGYWICGENPDDHCGEWIWKRGQRAN